MFSTTCTHLRFFQNHKILLIRSTPSQHQSNKSVWKEMHINKLLLYTLVIKSYDSRLETFLFRMWNNCCHSKIVFSFELRISNIFKSFCGHFRFLCKFLIFLFRYEFNRMQLIFVSILCLVAVFFLLILCKLQHIRLNQLHWIESRVINVLFSHRNGSFRFVYSLNVQCSGYNAEKPLSFFG